MLNILSHIIERTESYLASLPKKTRKSIGQFLTSQETAAFMASLFQVPADLSQATILDAGAGTGILSAALVERLQHCHTTLNSIHLVCYENDAQIVGLPHTTRKMNKELTMDEKSQILFMQIRILRIASTRLKRSFKDTAMLFREYDVLPYIREGYGIFHVEGDDAVYEDVKKYLLLKGAAI